MNQETGKAFGIAAHDLRACYSDKGILAGLTHFTQYWARDSFFASLGATSLEDFGIAKKQLLVFLQGQRSDGMIPSMVTKKGKYLYRLLGGQIVDGTALFEIAFADYVKESRDWKFAEANFSGLRKAVDWLHHKDKDGNGLIEEGIFCNWADSVLKWGRVLYSNCLYYKALLDFAEIARVLKKEKEWKQYSELAEQTRKAINQKFWLEEKGHYADWICFGKRKYFASDGNALAMWFGIASREQAKRIAEFAEKNSLNNVPMKTNFPPYFPIWVPVFFWLSSASKYHNGFSWLWLGAVYALGLEKCGMHEKAVEELEKIAGIINKHNTVHEIFTQDGKPVDSLVLKSEHPFAWSAGLFLRAVKEICGKA